MKLLHLSDLHLGKRLNEYPLIEDQKYILEQILQLVAKEQPDAVLLAGDIYDKSIPTTEAVQLCDDFLTKLASAKVPVCMISGNHDSAERLDFGARLLQHSGVHVGACYRADSKPVVLQDEYGPVNIYLLPFVKPALVRHALPEAMGEEIVSYHTAVAKAVELMAVDTEERNVLVCHQFVTGAQMCDSEAVNVGGLDNIGAEVFKDFDYVALGHIHSPQNIGNERIRYCGTPLNYSFSEWKQEKSVTVVELGAIGDVKVRLLPLVPMRELRKVRGTYSEVFSKSFYADFPMDENEQLKDFYHITLTDELDVPDAVQKLRSVYKNLLQLEYDNARTRMTGQVEAAEAVEQKSSLELISEFYALQNNQELSDEQKQFVQELLERLEGEE